MEIGNEIGQKIRSAIKAKLVELGAYVDDELPDYIMVMVANRKTEEQMAEDLSLFLSNNTNKFTTWLHNLLEKLQSLTANEPSGAAEGSGGGSRSKPSLPGSHSSTRVAQEPLQEQTVAVTVAKSGDSGQSKLTEDSPLPTISASARPTVDEEPVIKLTPEHDEFEDEGIVEKEKLVAKVPQIKSESLSAVSETSPAKESRKESRKISVGATETRKRSREDEEYVPQPVSKQLEAKKRLGAHDRQLPAAKYTRTTSETVGSRRTLGSSVGAVLQHDNDDEEEYDPRRPAIGNVASVIKVTERRSSVPVTLQANKSLLMKAMQQAEQSVAKARQHLFSAAPVSTATAKAEQTDRQITKVVRVSESDTGLLPLTTVKQSAAADVKTDSQDRVATLTSSDLRRSLMPLPSSDVTQLVRRSTGQPSVGGQLTGVTGQVESDLMMQESLDLMDQDEESVDSEEDGLRQLLLLQQTNMKLGQRAGSPKFVVTFDGASESLTEMDMVDEDTLLASSSASARNVVRVKPQTQALARLQEVEDDVPVGSNSSTTKLHANERCKFWPACKNGDACQFHHPTQPCKTFPACRFGDACLFIHPNCKFDASCRNARCPYTHSCPRRLTAASAAVPVIVQPVRVPVYMPRVPRFHAPRPAAPKQTPCKFFPRCTDMNCPFLHPKPCRYGLSCVARQTSCPFSHPDFPDKQKMKWTAPKAGPSSSS